MVAITRTLKLGTVLVAAALLGACTSAASADSSDDASQAAESYPLDEFLSGVWGLSPEETNRVRAEVQARRDELIVQCMLDAGFEYVPWAGAGAFQSPRPPDDRDWVAEWGYGVVNSPHGGRHFWQPPDAGPDPNADIVSALSPSQRRYYNLALHGSIVHGDREGEPGCLERAAQQVPENIWHLAQFTPLLEALEELRVKEVPDVQAGNRQWSECMTDSGFPGFESPDEAYRYVLASAPVGAGVGPGSPEAPAFQEYEISLALADYDCRAVADLRARTSAARYAKEAQFVEDHRAILTEARDAARQLGIARQ